MTKNTILKTRISEKDKQAIFDYCKKNELNSYLYEKVIIDILKKDYKDAIDNIKAIIKTEYETII